MDLFKVLPILKNTIIKANNKIMQIYQNSFDNLKIKYKQDKSPITIADLESNKIICSQLNSINNLFNIDILIISEENKNIVWEKRKNYEYCWLVDPIDGTKEFIKKNGEFTTNIGLIKNGKVIFGIVGIPTLNTIYWGGVNIPSLKFNYQTNESQLLIPRISQNPFIVVISRSHSDQDTVNYLKTLETTYKNVKTIVTGSSIKLLMIAEGIANIYPRFGYTMEWDTCAAHGVLKGLNINIINYFDNNELNYNKKNLLNPYFITK